MRRTKLRVAAGHWELTEAMGGIDLFADRSHLPAAQDRVIADEEVAARPGAELGVLVRPPGGAGQAASLQRRSTGGRIT